MAWEKQQKEIDRQEEMVRRLAGGANTGRATTAEKTLEKLKAEGTYVEKPFVPKTRYVHIKSMIFAYCSIYSDGSTLFILYIIAGHLPFLLLREWVRRQLK